MRRRYSPTLILALAHFAPAAFAAVTCSVTTTSVAFGTYNPLAAGALDSTGSVQVTCTLTPPPSSQRVNYTIQLSSGASGNYASRYMQSGASRLNYNLFTDNARTQIWGNGSAGSTIVNGSLRLQRNGNRQTRSTTYTMYGRMPALQDVAPGGYSDSITVTLAF